MRRHSLVVAGCLLATSMVTVSPAVSQDGDEGKAEKFEELEARHADEPQRLALAKARWLTERGNAAGQAGEPDDAIQPLREAIEIKNDYFPAHLSLALAHLSSGRHDKALGVIHDAPLTMRLGDAELGGFEYDVYYVKMLIYADIPDHDQGLAVAREGLKVLDDPALREQRQRSEELGVVGEGSGSQIYGVLERYVKVRESRDSS